MNGYAIDVTGGLGKIMVNCDNDNEQMIEMKRGKTGETREGPTETQGKLRTLKSF